ncbi:MAG: Vitamin B12 dependent methionine synthase activation subunit [Clostridia bacterium]|nr:Vitamin B12 dependent methionine synthase activation subunit [Clostridia bacterium]
MRELSTVSRSEVYRYMGFRDELPEMHLQELCETVISQVAAAASPKFCAADTAVEVCESVVKFDSFSVESKSLANHLSECDEGVIFAATLGSGVDMLIYKYSTLSPAKAVAAQAAATAMIEMYADDICEVIAEEEKTKDYFITPRFSPGYGDLTLDCQTDFLNLLSAGKRIGVCLTDADMLTPVKSITAVVGKCKKQFCESHKKCEKCSNINCAYRK